jgi:hypothetical protein
MRYGFLAVLAASAALATGAMAQDDAVFGNTVVMTHADGSATRVHFQQGGVYDFVTASGVTGGGTWAVEGGQFCTTRLTPAPQPKQCRPDMQRHVGDKWEEDTPAGHVKYELVAGQ